MQEAKIKSKIIRSASEVDFANQMDKFLETVEYGSIQYKPVSDDNVVVYTALVLYQVEEEDKDGS